MQNDGGVEAAAGSQNACVLVRQFHCPRPIFSPSSQLTILAVGCLATACAVAGNLLVITAIAFFRQLQTRANALSLSLATFDLLVAVMTMPYHVEVTAYSCWFHGRTFCSVHYLLGLVLCNGAVITTCCIAFDRYVAICDPLRYEQRLTRRTAANTVAFTWAGAALLSAPVFAAYAVFRTSGGPAGSRCPDECVTSARTGADVFLVLFPFAAFLLTVIVLYARIYAAARKQARRLGAAAVAVVARRPAAGVGADRDRAAKRCSRSASRTLLIIVGFFAASCASLLVLTVVDLATGFSVNKQVWSLMSLVAFANSTLNPLVYVASSRRFRVAFRAIFTGRLLRAGGRATDLDE